MRTVNGQMMDVKTYQAQAAPPANATFSMSMDTVNPRFDPALSGSSTYEKNLLDAQAKTIGEDESCCSWRGFGARLESRRGRAGLCCCLLFMILFGIILGVLYPRFPTVGFDSADSIHSLKFQKIGNKTFRLYGNATIVINNPNVYAISLAGLNVTDTWGNSPSTISFTERLDNFNIPAEGLSLHIIPVNVVFPSTFNAVEFGALITQCTTTGLVSVIRGVAEINIVGLIYTWNFGPQQITSSCLSFI